MTTEEKLEHFQSFCIQDVKNQSAKILEDYMAELERQFNDHKIERKRQADLMLQSETEKISQELNKKLAIEQLNNKRIFSHKQEELKKKLFIEVQDLLETFMMTPEYEKLLQKLIKEAKDFAGENELIIYIDPTDGDKVRRLSLDQNVDLTISEYSFSGGIRAVIPSKNILIDHSFAAKLEETKHNFQFHTHTGGIDND